MGLFPFRELDILLELPIAELKPKTLSQKDNMELFDAAQLIKQGIQASLQSKQGYLVGRNGTIEMDLLLSDFYHRHPSKGQLATLEMNAGIFPAKSPFVEKWLAETKLAIQKTDLLIAGWYAPNAKEESFLLDSLGKKGPFLPLRALEPYYVPTEYHWTRWLQYRKVAVVSSFAETCLEQTKKASGLWGDRAASLLPDATYIPIQTGYSPVLAQGRAGWPTGTENWEQAVDSVVRRVLESEAEIVLIGCGGLGMIIGSRLKEAGKICVVMGGAIQVLFGIKGRRWQTHSTISRFWNDAWVFPKESETPAGYTFIEGGCYWGKN
jgi:hypothetical protein